VIVTANSKRAARAAVGKALNGHRRELFPRNQTFVVHDGIAPPGGQLTIVGAHALAYAPMAAGEDVELRSEAALNASISARL
jgi:hypothetical protein